MKENCPFFFFFLLIFYKRFIHSFSTVHFFFQENFHQEIFIGSSNNEIAGMSHPHRAARASVEGIYF